MLQSKLIYFGVISQTFRLTENATAAFRVRWGKHCFPPLATVNAQIFHHINQITHVYLQICKRTVLPGIDSLLSYGP